MPRWREFRALPLAATRFASVHMAKKSTPREACEPSARGRGEHLRNGPSKTSKCGALDGVRTPRCSRWISRSRRDVTWFRQFFAPKKMIEVVELAKTYGIQVIFFEASVSDELARVLARETGARTLVLNPGANLTKEEMRLGKTFFYIMEDMNIVK